eukprot:4649319-Pyramimonas_sp.AAC.1
MANPVWIPARSEGARDLVGKLRDRASVRAGGAWQTESSSRLHAQGRKGSQPALPAGRPRAGPQQE